ncbi:MAG: hypothetical protein JO053_15430 [Acidobacteria bacterium]|nr:hypothetical protein [Acidobacteriota bacterium]
MFALVTNFLLLLAETAKTANPGVWANIKQFENDWLNIPGFEGWRFLNLAIFVGLMIWASKKIGLPEAFKKRREEIRADLIRAEEEKKAALARLTSAEGKLAQLETEKENILTKAKDEAAFEKKRVAAETKADTERLRAQAEAELARLASQTRVELRRFSAQESIRLAEEKLRKQIDGKADARLVKASISEIGGLN